jgi:predicted ATPase
LTSLVDKSLLRHRDDRFSMLETIREYAAERLKSSGDADELRRRHADHFLALAEEADRRLWQGSPGEWLDRLDAELDNARAALDRLEMSGEAQLAMRFAGALWRFWNMRGHLVEGRRRLVRALAADERPTAARAGALIGCVAAR